MEVVQSSIESQTLAALLTSTARAAVAVVAVWSKDAVRLDEKLSSLFTPIGSRAFSQLPNRTLVYGVWNASQEDLVVVRKANGVREIHCHGGQVAVAAVLESLKEANCVSVSASSLLGCVQGRWVTETQAALSNAETKKAATAIMRVAQVQPQQFGQWMGELKKIVALSSDEKDGQKVEQREKMASRLADSMKDSLAFAPFGQYLTRPRSVVLCGKPNVGKSSLINRIVGFDRVIVNEQAGTTRDLVGQKTAIDGWPVELLDTAGIRDSQNEIESIGIAKALAAVEKADVRIAVLDACLPFCQEDANLIERIKPDVVVFNKWDQRVDRVPEIASDDVVRSGGIFVSAKTGENIDVLLDRIASCLNPAEPPEDRWFPVTQWQIDQLQSIVNAIAEKDYVSAAQRMDEH